MSREIFGYERQLRSVGSNPLAPFSCAIVHVSIAIAIAIAVEHPYLVEQSLSVTLAYVGACYLFVSRDRDTNVSSTRVHFVVAVLIA